MNISQKNFGGQWVRKKENDLKIAIKEEEIY